MLLPPELDHLLARRAARNASARFETAAALLAGEGIAARLAGVALCRALWNEADEWGEAVEDVLSAFVRRRTFERPLSEERLPLDVGAALSALGGRPLRFEHRPLDLSGVRLAGVEWPFARLRSAHLHGADLRGALLVGADLRGAWLRGTNLGRANLDKTDLRGADLRGARGTDPVQLRRAISDAKTLWPV